jgi:hypothetical protein
MSDDLITLLRELAAAKHGDLSVAADAADEVERLRAERDALRSAAREYLETLGGAMKSGKFEMGGTAEMAHFVRQAMQKLDSLVFNRDGPRPAGLERLHETLKRPS